MYLIDQLELIYILKEFPAMGISYEMIERNCPYITEMTMRKDVYKRQSQRRRSQDKAGGDRCCQQDTEHSIPRRKPKRQIVAFTAG